MALPIDTQLNIAGRMFPVELSDDEKDRVTEDVALVNYVYQDFQKIYPHKDKLDLVIMAFLKVNSERAEEFEQKLKNLESVIQQINEVLPTDI